jgi:uncharacterized protein YkwD
MNRPTRRQFLFLSASVVGALLPTAQPAFAQAPPRAQMLAAVNGLRSRYHVGPLAYDAFLQDAAERQARLMAERDTLSHDLGPGLDLRARMDAVGYHGVVGENVAAGYPTLATVLDGWMASAGHRRNLLRPAFTEFGLAYASIPKTSGRQFSIYWAMEFGGHQIP